MYKTANVFNKLPKSQQRKPSAPCRKSCTATIKVREQRQSGREFAGGNCRKEGVARLTVVTPGSVFRTRLGGEQDGVKLLICHNIEGSALARPPHYRPSDEAGYEFQTHGTAVAAAKASFSTATGYRIENDPRGHRARAPALSLPAGVLHAWRFRAPTIKVSSKKPNGYNKHDVIKTFKRPFCRRTR